MDGMACGLPGMNELPISHAQQTPGACVFTEGADNQIGGAFSFVSLGVPV